MRHSNIHVQRWAPVGAAIAIAFALVGFLQGLGAPRSETPELSVAVPTSGVVVPDTIPPAVTYSELPSARLRANAHWEADLRTLRQTPAAPPEVGARTAALLEEARAHRRRRRAYEGAPPTVPHPIAQRDSASCLACHDQGIRSPTLFAPPISHPPYANCTQCHAGPAGGDENVAGAEPLALNSFTGFEHAGGGTRAWPGAPPTIPHPTWMRDNCLSCHGNVARAGLRTSHPYRANCTQCHAPSAELDQAAGAAGPGEGAIH